MWPHIDKLAIKLRAMVDNIQDGKKILEGIEHRDMSESEPEEEPKYIPKNKSLFVIPKVERKVKKKKQIKIDKDKFKDDKAIFSPISNNKNNTDHNQAKKKNDTDYEDEYENEFDDYKNSDKKGDSDDGYDDDFENEDGAKEEKKLAKAKSQTNSPTKDYKEIPKTNKKPTTSKQIRTKYSTNQKPISNRSRLDLNITKGSQKQKTKISMFNSRVSNVTRGTRRDRDMRDNNMSQIKHYNNLNRSSIAGKKTRPNTFANKSNLYNSDHVSSLTNIRAHSKKKLGTSFKEKRRPLSSRRPHGKKDKEILILVTKTYDLQLKIGKSNNKKISYVNKDEKE